MIESLEFENFKKFKREEVKLDKPITLLYGENSSGKSSILKGLGALLQTFVWSLSRHEPLVVQGDFANLGTFRDYVHEHDIYKKVSFTITHPPGIGWMPNEVGGKAVKSYRTRLCYDRSPYTEQARIYSIDTSAILSDGSVSSIFKVKRAETKPYYVITTSAEAFARQIRSRDSAEPSFSTIWKLATKKSKMEYLEGFSFIPFADDPDKSTVTNKQRVMEGAIFSLFDISEKYRYLGPLRSSPSRSYTMSAVSSDVGPRGEKTPSVISYLRRSSGGHNANREGFAKIQHWIDLLFPGRSISVQDYEELVKLKIKRGNIEDSIQDVGFGFSQILPIIVQAAALGKDQTIIVEQPELHLHPRAQVAFSQFLVEASREGIRFIIETHSEHILRGLQLAISDNSLNDNLGITKDDLRVYYFPSEQGRNAFEIELNSDGELVDGWPAGFFDEAYNLTRKIITNKISKMTGKANESSN